MLLITDTVTHKVAMGTEDKVSGQGVCKGVTLQLQGVDVYNDFLPLRLGSSNIILGIQWLETLGMTHIDDFLPLRLGSSNIILGIQWLETLGMTHIDWKQQVTKFQLGGSTSILRGDPSLSKTLILLKAMI